MDPRLHQPLTCVVAGPTGCGKTRFVMRLLAHTQTMFHPVPTKVVWCYGEWQELYGSVKNVQFVEGLPDIQQLQPHTLVVVDDLMAETDERVTKLFTKGSHHRNISVIYIVQNVFNKNKENRTISLNAHYMVLFKNPRDSSQITNLAKQMYPGHSKYMQEVFRDATAKPHGYLFVDLKQNTPDYLRLRAQIFPDEIQYVYMRK